MHKARIAVATMAMLAWTGAASAAPCAGFTDVEDTSAFCGSVAWMKNRGITLGCTATLYCPNDFVRRDQMAAFMYRLGFQNAFLNGGNAFGDTALIGTTDNNAVNFVVNQQAIGGFNANQFFVGPPATTGTSAAIEGTTFSTSANAKGVLGVVASMSAGGASSGVKGLNSATTTSGYGVFGEHTGAGVGVYGSSASGTGVEGFVAGGTGVRGTSGTGSGVFAGSFTGIGLEAVGGAGNAVDASSVGIGLGNATGVFRNTDATAGEPGGIAVYAYNQSGDATIVARNAGAGDAIRVLNTAGNALVFRVSNNGTVRADGSYNCGLASGCFNAGLGADVAERIDATEDLAPGEVVEIDPDAPGRYRRSRSPGSALVAGVVSARPAITLNNADLATGRDERTDVRPLIALVGTVEVRAVVENGPIRAGDLLVSASRPGTAMRGGERAMIGTVIGKALTPLVEGEGKVSMLVMLR